MNSQLFNLGDHLAVWRGFFWHHGIYVGDERVIHFSGEPLRLADAAIGETQVSKFADGAAITVIPYTGNEEHPPDEVVRRARSLIGRRGYDLAANNCEHFAVWCKTGNHSSAQVDTVRKVLLMNPALGTLALGILNTHLLHRTAERVAEIAHEIKYLSARIDEIPNRTLELIRDDKLDEYRFRVLILLKDVAGGTGDSAFTAQAAGLNDAAVHLESYARMLLGKITPTPQSRRRLVDDLIFAGACRALASRLRDEVSISARKLADVVTIILEEVRRLHMGATPWDVASWLWIEVAYYSELLAKLDGMAADPDPRRVALRKEAMQNTDELTQFASVAFENISGPAYMDLGKYSIYPDSTCLSRRDQFRPITLADLNWIADSLEIDASLIRIQDAVPVNRSDLEKMLGKDAATTQAIQYEPSVYQLLRLHIPEVWTLYNRYIETVFGFSPHVCKWPSPYLHAAEGSIYNNMRSFVALAAKQDAAQLKQQLDSRNHIIARMHLSFLD